MIYDTIENENTDKPSLKNNVNYQTLGQALMANNSGLFLNDNGEYCRICKYYVKNTLYIQVIFSKGLMETATRFAIKSTSEKRILKLLNSENFKLVTE